MAPKRARQATSSSSSQQAAIRPANDPSRFASYEAEEKLNIIARRPLLIEYTIDLHDPENKAGGVLASIAERGWGFILEASIPVNASIVREFYANWERISQAQVFLRGRHILVDQGSLREHLAIPPTPFDEEKDDHELLLEKIKEIDLEEIKNTITYPGSSWVYNHQNQPLHVKNQNLNLEARIWMRILFSHIVPCSHTTNLTMDQVMLLHCLVTGQRVYLPRLIRHQMERVHHDKASSILPYPTLITRMALAGNVPLFADDDIRPERKTISIQTLLPRDAKAQRKATAPSSSSSAYPGPSMAYMDAMQQAIIAQIQQSEARLEQRIEASERRLMRRMRRLGLQESDSEETVSEAPAEGGGSDQGGDDE